MGYKWGSNRRNGVVNRLPSVSFQIAFYNLGTPLLSPSPFAILVQLRACRDPVVYEQKVEHFLTVILVDCADQHAV